MVNVMFQLFGKDGILEKGGFVRDGYVYKNVFVFVILFGSFGNRLLLLYEVMKVYYELIGDGVFVLVVQLFFMFDDFCWLIDWF